MPRNAENIQRRIFGSQDRFFIDTNVWLYVNGPIAGNPTLRNSVERKGVIWKMLKVTLIPG